MVRRFGEQGGVVRSPTLMRVLTPSALICNATSPVEVRSMPNGGLLSARYSRSITALRHRRRGRQAGPRR
jgi:hypothetical protein